MKRTNSRQRDHRGGGAGANLPVVNWRGPPEQVAHQVELCLALESVGMAKRSHGNCGGVGAEQESADAKGVRNMP
jgi:hypothetical protein